MATSRVKKKRPRRKQLNPCRICLTYSASLKNLNEDFEDNSETISIQKVLEDVMCCEVLITEEVPNHICSVCLSFLKISYDFKKRFEESHKKLFGDKNLKYTETCKDVDLIIGDKNFSLEDVVIVDDEENKEDYSKLLNKLGKTVTIECSKAKGHISGKFSNPKQSYISEAVNDNNCEGILNDEDYETIIIKYTSDSDDLNESECVTKRNNTDLSDKIESFIIEDDNVNVQCKQTLTTKECVNFSVCTDVLESVEKRKNVEKLKEIEKYIIYENDYEEKTSKIEDPTTNQGNDGLSLTNQFNSVTQVEVSSALQYPCEECSLSFKTRIVLKRHLNFVHGIPQCNIKDRKEESKKTKELINKSTNDGTKLKEESRLPRDIRRKHQLQKWREKFKRNPMLCQICGHIAKSSGGAKYHSLTHGERRFKCSICPKKFFTPSHLKNHLQYKHEKNISKHLCPICGEYRNSYTALRYHLKVHTNDPKKYSCPICNLSFLIKGALKTHLRRHMGDRRYLCNLCDRSFFTNNEKKKHMFVHTGEKPFKCKYCEKRFATPFNQKIHMITHSGPHLCKICFRGLADKEMLKMHIKYKHQSEQKAKKSRIGNLNKVIDEDEILADNKELVSSSLITDGTVMESLENMKSDDTKDEDFEFPQHFPGASSDNVILQVLNLLDASEEDALKFEEVDVN